MTYFGRILVACSVVLSFGLSTAVASTVSQQTAQDALKKDAVCTRCHDETASKPNVLYLYLSKHGARADGSAPTCQSCHGESRKHLEGNVAGGGRPPVDVVFKKGAYGISDDHARAGQCTSCHAGKARSHWEGSQHQAAGVACNDCHKVHQPTDKVRVKLTQAETCFTCHKEQRADSHKVSSHPIDAGKIACSDCHNPHGSAGPKLLKTTSVNETCWTCHAEKRGPYAFEHQPAVENCANCHTPHGSNITPLLKSRPPFLCQECHDGTHASATPAGINSAGYQGGLAKANSAGAAQFPNKNLVGRACMNCHSQVHGSNSPAGGFLQR